MIPHATDFNHVGGIDEDEDSNSDADSLPCLQPFDQIQEEGKL